MLQVNPKKRPSAEKLLNSNLILNKVEELFEETLADTNSILLRTIRWTKNLKQLSNRLPEPKYKTNIFSSWEDEIEPDHEQYILPKLMMNQSVEEIVKQAENIYTSMKPPTRSIDFL